MIIDTNLVKRWAFEDDMVRVVYEDGSTVEFKWQEFIKVEVV